jgi:hypothetical protein
MKKFKFIKKDGSEIIARCDVVEMNGFNASLYQVSYRNIPAIDQSIMDNTHCGFICDVVEFYCVDNIEAGPAVIGSALGALHVPGSSNAWEEVK